MKIVQLQYLENGTVNIISNDIDMLNRWLSSSYCEQPKTMKDGYYQVTVSHNWSYRSTFRRKKNKVSQNTGRA